MRLAAARIISGKCFLDGPQGSPMILAIFSSVIIQELLGTNDIFGLPVRGSNVSNILDVSTILVTTALIIKPFSLC